MKYDYIIIGCGLSGLMSGYILNKYNKKSKILILEKNNYIGGQLYNTKKNGIYKEHSPRVILSNYKNFMRYIPNYEKNKGKKLDNKIIKDGKLYKTTEIFTIMDYIKLFLLQIYHKFSSRERMDDIKLYDKISDKSEILSNILGETKESIPYYKMNTVIENMLKNKENYTTTMKGPFYETIIEPIKKELNKNVEIKLEKEIKYINRENNKIIDQNGIEYYYKDLILAYNFNDKETEDKQLSIQIQFNELLKLPKEISGYFSIDSSWKLIIGPYENIWEDEYKIDKSLWSINITDLDKLSPRLNKKVKECSKKEIIEEVIYLIEKELKLNIKDYKYNIEYIKYYPNKINGIKKRIKPGKIYENIYICGANTDTTYYNTFMEGAIESVIKMINEILNINLYVYNHRTTNILKKLDKYFYSVFSFVPINLSLLLLSLTFIASLYFFFSFEMISILSSI